MVAKKKEGPKIAASGAYILRIRRLGNGSIRVGARRVMEFPAGEYFYVGRAGRGLKARLDRHASDDKKAHWHIDYLLLDPGTELVSWEVFPGQGDRECELVKELLQQKRAVPVEGFGNRIPFYHDLVLWEWK